MDSSADRRGPGEGEDIRQDRTAQKRICIWTCVIRDGWEGEGEGKSNRKRKRKRNLLNIGNNDDHMGFGTKESAQSMDEFMAGARALNHMIAELARREDVDHIRGLVANASNLAR